PANLIILGEGQLGTIFVHYGFPVPSWVTGDLKTNFFRSGIRYEGTATSYDTYLIAQGDYTYQKASRYWHSALQLPPAEGSVAITLLVLPLAVVLPKWITRSNYADSTTLKTGFLRVESTVMIVKIVGSGSDWDYYQQSLFLDPATYNDDSVRN